MQKDSLITYASGLIFVIGLGLLFLGWNYQARTQESPLLPSNLPLAESLPVDPNFRPNKNTNLSFEAQAEITPKNESMFTMKIQYNGQGTARFEATQDGSATEFFITPSSRIFCDEVQCYGTAPDPSDKEFSIEEYTFDPEEIRELGQGLVLIGEEKCGQQLCSVWSSPTPVEIDAPKVLIDQATQNIVEISGKQGSDFVKITYVYKDVTVILPLNVLRN